ncbi:hypothetical protein [Vibrio crassostreae]|uniref:hypothetical protein n=1 Tax=Vibrio crassostreae TaxID=246167 RepID=UPI001B316F88|nr:hypothetical protein [Vibrio crassostreae]
MATTKTTATDERKTYVVTIPFPWRGHWTKRGQELALLVCEAQALLITEKISLKQTGSK